MPPFHNHRSPYIIYCIAFVHNMHEYIISYTRILHLKWRIQTDFTSSTMAKRCFMMFSRCSAIYSAPFELVWHTAHISFLEFWLYSWMIFPKVLFNKMFSQSILFVLFDRLDEESKWIGPWLCIGKYQVYNRSCSLLSCVMHDWFGFIISA